MYYEPVEFEKLSITLPSNGKDDFAFCMDFDGTCFVAGYDKGYINIWTIKDDEDQFHAILNTTISLHAKIIYQVLITPTTIVSCAPQEKSVKLLDKFTFVPWANIQAHSVSVDKLQNLMYLMHVNGTLYKYNL